MRGWAETEPFRVSIVIGLYEGEDGGPATVDDAETWSDLTRLTTPILADPAAAFTVAMPFTGARPLRCALSPRMEILECYEGEPADPANDPAIEAIRAHWQANGD
jgi:hypothetical protein